MECYHLPHQTIPILIDHLMTLATVIAPHAKGEKSFTYAPVAHSRDVVLEYNRTLLSLKKFFLPPVEQLLSYSIRNQTVSETVAEPVERIFFAVHSYEMQAILRLDHNMLEGHPEKNYITRRTGARFVGISFEPDEFHFSRSVGIRVEEMGGFDLFLNKVGEDYHLFVITDAGEKMLTGFQELAPVKSAGMFERHFKNKIKYHYNRLPEVLDHVYQSEVWQKVAGRCVGCGACNLTCPTCYCFDVMDTLDLSVQSGERSRRWDGCLLTPFAEVAGGENFRDKFSQRLRHRIYRKFKYITDSESTPWCTGCGRCTAYCPAGISITEIINDLIIDFQQQQYAKTNVKTTMTESGI